MAVRKLYASLKNRASFLYLVVAVFFASGMTLTVLLTLFLHWEVIRDEKAQALKDTGIIRADLEGELNSRLLLGRGLVAYVSLRRGITDAEFMLFAEKLINNDSLIRNLSLLRDTTVIYAAPLESNKKVIGVNLVDVPAQRDSVLYVKETGKPIVISSVRLVQGGIGTVCRLPVFIDGEIRQEGTGHYWGQIGIVLREDDLLKKSNIFRGAGGYDYALYEMNSDGAKKFLYGSDEIFGRNPVVLDVAFPYGKWTLAVVPIRGWGRADLHMIRYAAAGLFSTIVLSLMLFLWIRSRIRIRQLEELLPMCSSCKKIRNEDGTWDPVETLFSGEKGVTITHSLCPDCVKKLYGDKEWFSKGKEK